MDRREWGEILGDDISIEADLRWSLFQAERSLVTMDREADGGIADQAKDGGVYRINQRRVRHAKVALAHLWLRGDRVFEIEGTREW